MRSVTGYGRELAALALVLAVAAAAPSCGRAAGSGSPTAGDLRSGRTRVPGQYLATMAPGTDMKALTDIYGRFGIKEMRDLGQSVFLLILTEDPGPAVMEELRQRNSRIKAVQPNFLYRANDPGAQ